MGEGEGEEDGEVVGEGEGEGEREREGDGEGEGEEKGEECPKLQISRIRRIPLKCPKISQIDPFFHLIRFFQGDTRRIFFFRSFFRRIPATSMLLPYISKVVLSEV